MIENRQTQRIKIALVSNSAWSVFNFRLEVIRHLLLRAEVLVIAPADEFVGLLTAEGCQFIPVSFNNRSENPLRDFSLYSQLKKIYQAQKPDCIFHYVIKPNIYGSLAAAACGIPSVAVITGLGYSFAKKNWLSRTVSALYKYALRKTNEVWFLNQEDAGIFINGRLIDAQKSRILPGEGVDIRHFAPAAYRPVARSKAFQFLMSTRLLRSKGVGIFAEAARILLQRKLDVRFVLIGFFEKDHPDSITSFELKAWQKKGLLQYSGFVRDVRPFLRQADCFVFPSFYKEGIPRCLLEAAAMEIPIITSRNRGCSEVVEDGLNGLLLENYEPAHLAQMMETMINYSVDRRQQMGHAGRSRILDRFDMGRIIDQYDQTLRNIKIL